ncbi:MAG: FAD binding domain-containing protein [Burkholderiaceae bacterium]
MKPRSFDYVRAETAQQACDLLQRHGEDSRILAGGQSLMTVLNMRLAQPSVLIDISQSHALAETTLVQSSNVAVLQVGAAVTQASLEWRSGLAIDLPLLYQAIPYISHFQIRNRGTVCGSVAHADPSAELPLCLLALQGEIVLQSAKSERVLKAQDFFTGMLSTARKSDELLTAVRFPLASAGQGFGFKEFSLRHGDYALCAVAVVASAHGLRIAVGGVADFPIAQDWPTLQETDLDDALNEFAWSLEARDDLHLSAAQRRHLVRNLGRQALDQALAQSSMKWERT